jgi:hypothetical protein
MRLRNEAAGAAVEVAEAEVERELAAVVTAAAVVLAVVVMVVARLVHRPSPITAAPR